MGEMASMKALLVFGLGYSASVFAARMRSEGWAVTGTSTTPENLARIAEAGFVPMRFDGETENPDLSHAIAAATHVLVSVPPGAAGDPVLMQYANELACAPNLAWIGYLSTVGVYGDRAGAWVDETTQPQPLSRRSQERLCAEYGWLDLTHKNGVPVQIFRLPGIYGPGRNALEQLAGGEKQRVYKPGQVFNRIHVADIAAVLAAAAVRAGAHPTPPGAIFNVTDDEPAPPQDVIEFAAKLMGIEPPPLVPLEDAGLSPMARSFYAENKRVRNDKIKRELGAALLYPTYREGLSSLDAAMRGTPS
jgi:nucleoside-diphosphate-sugar epimerase